MKVLRYLWQGGKLLFYITFSVVISLIISLILRGIWDFSLFLKLFALSFLLFVLLRAADDYFDYEKDRRRKKQPLTKRGILYLMLVVAAFFVWLNVLFYSFFGLCSIIVLGYLLAQQKAEFLKLFFMPVVSAFYFYFNRTGNMPFLAIGIYLAVCLILSLAFYFFKRKRSK